MFPESAQETWKDGFHNKIALGKQKMFLKLFVNIICYLEGKVGL
jgi:hypothetical protein